MKNDELTMRMRFLYPTEKSKFEFGILSEGAIQKLSKLIRGIRKNTKIS
jgi:hypothetical protein